MASLATRAPPFQSGVVLAGTYEISNVLRIGETGVLYEARDRLLPRPVAIKAVFDPSQASALRDEALALAAIRHPAFVGVHHFGRHDETDFLVMERLFGDRLDERLEATGRPPDIAMTVELLLAITDGLAAAHRVGITHRDVKSSNIVLTGERVVLVDLGLAIHAPDEELFGDLHALGALAYELLTNEPPPEGESAPDPRTLRPEIPDGLAALVRELLAKDLDDRPPSAEAVFWQLKELRGYDGIRAPRCRVLVVDDDPATGRAIERALQQNFPALEVRATTDPRIALGGRDVADVVVFDLWMPGMHGLELCAAMEELPAGQRPVLLAMSAYAEPTEVSRLRALGVARFVTKDATLFAAISDTLSHLRSGSHAPI